MASHNLQNGVLPNQQSHSQHVDQFKSAVANNDPRFNGVHSAQSSRSASPSTSSTRLQQIPSAQLPPSARNIPATQLPPSSRSPINLAQNMGQMTLNTPSTGVSARFSTSTPNQGENSFRNSSSSGVFSPITPLVPKPVTVQQQNGQNPFANYKPTQQPFTNEKLNNVQNQNLIENNAPSLNLNNTPQIGQNNNNLVGQTFKSSMPVKPQFPNTTTSTVQNPTSNINGPNLAPFNSINPQPNMQAPQTSSAMPTNYHQIPKNSVPVPVATQPAAQSNQAAFPNISTFQNQPQPKINGANLPPSSSATQPPQSRPGMPTNYNQLPTNNVPVPSVNSAMVPSQSATQSPITTNPNQFKATLHNNRYPTQPKNPQNLFPAGNNYSQPQSNQNYHPSQPFPQQNQFQQFPQQTQQQFPPQTTQFAPQTPAYPQPSQFNNVYQNQSVYGNSVTQSGFNKLWGSDNYDLLQSPNILPPKKEPAPRIHLGQQQLDEANCTSDIFRCTMTRIPESNSLLQKSRLPLGILIHPFKDLNHLPVIQCNVIVRCRACRTYINPFVYFVDCKRWKCNLCYRVNELPDEFQFDPVSKSYGDPTRRPEIKSSTIEYIAPAEYMLRPPQPAVYLFLLDVSRLAVESGYLNTICNILIEEMDNLPGDSRTQVGFITFDSVLHFFSLAEGLSKPHEMTVLDVDDVFLPTPDNLLVNLKDHKELVVELLSQLPNKYSLTYDTNSALGAALQAAFKMMSATGGRVTVFQAALPNVGPGALTAREDPSQRTSTQEVQHLNPANDFYKRLALECSGQQIAVDLFVVNSQYVDMATISGISRFSGGSVQHFPLFKATRPVQNEALSRCFRRYLVRKIGFEAVMRIRCTRGLSIHTFHGNFFVRSTDLLSLPNVNPDAGFGMQVSIDENLSDVKSVCFQAALLYTSSKGERRIRVHTLCMPICATLHDVINSADQECIVGLLSKMAVDRSMQSSLSDAREAFINVAIDILSSYKLSLNMSSGTSGLMAPECLRLLPLFISALLKSAAFRTGTSTRLDDRVKAMIDMKTKPLSQLMQLVYPDLYPVHDLEHQEVIINSDEETIPLPPRLQLTARCLDSKGAFLLDAGDQMILLVCPNVAPTFLTQVLGVPNYNAISEVGGYLPVLDNPHNMRLHMFLNYLNGEKPYAAPLQIIKDNSPNRAMFFERLIEDRVENALSYHEFLQHIKTQIK